MTADAGPLVLTGPTKPTRTVQCLFAGCHWGPGTPHPVSLQGEPCPPSEVLLVGVRRAEASGGSRGQHGAGGSLVGDLQ